MVLYWWYNFNVSIMSNMKSDSDMVFYPKFILNKILYDVCTVSKDSIIIFKMNVELNVNISSPKEDIIDGIRKSILSHFTRNFYVYEWCWQRAIANSKLQNLVSEM